MTKQEQIKELSKALTPQEIAETVDVSLSYVYRVLRIVASNPNNITLESYLEAILNGITSKSALADYFGVSRRTILRFEQRNNTKKVIGSYLYISGKEISEIKKILTLTNKEAEELSRLSNLKTITTELNKYLKLFSRVKYKPPKIKDLCRGILSALNSLNC